MRVSLDSLTYEEAIMRESFAGLAWIERRVGDESQWLVLWNERWQRFALVGGHLEADESFRECVRREVEEELGLTHGQDFQVSEPALAKLDYEAFSESVQEQTRYRHEVFSMTLTTDAQDRIESQPGVLWVTDGEIERRATTDGQPIAEQVERAWREIQTLSLRQQPLMRRPLDEFDFFVSYARADNFDGWITRFVEELLVEHRKFSGGRELTYFFDSDDIRSFDDWQHRLHHGLAKSRLFLAFISPSYFTREWCRTEWKAWIDIEIAKHVLSSGGALVYFVEVPGLVGNLPGLREQAMLDEHEVARQVAELCRLPEPHENFIMASAPMMQQMRDRRQITREFVQPLQQQGVDALLRDDLRRVLERLARDLDERTKRVRLAADSLSTVPPYNKQFSGRLNELLDLRQRLKDDRAGVICGVHGLGGIGKTELAFTYAHAFASGYPGGRFLVPCEGKSSLRDAALHLGDLFRDQISDEERKTAETYFAAIKSCLRERLDKIDHILLVLDNVSDLQVVSPQQTDLLTSLGPKLHLLATTRLLPPSGGAWLTLGELPDADALDLLEKHRPFERSVGGPPASSSDTDRTAALRIVKRLGGFALAVELVAAWLASHPETNYAQFAEGLGLEDLETIADSDDVELRRHNHQRRLSAVLGPVLDELQPAERRALEYAACLPPDLVPLPWLQTLVTQDFPDLSQRSRLSDPWLDLCRRLVRLALFLRVEEETTDQRLVRVHRLVQDLVRRNLDESTVAERQQSLQALIEERDRVLEQTTRWQDARWELEPLDALADLWAETGHQRASWLLNQAGHRWKNLADWALAEPLMRRALAIDELSYGAEHSRVAICLNNLAQLLQATNRLAEAEPLMRRALAIDEQSYGAEHPNAARHLNNLAGLLQATNRLAEAEPLMRRALAIGEQSDGAEHRSVAVNLNNLAQLLQATNRLAEAEPLMRRALAIDEQSYGAEHSDVAIDLNNLAQLLQATNRLAEAEPLIRRALAIDEQSYKAEHPNVARDLNNLALLLQATNRLAEAEPLMRRALAIFEQSYGAEHPNVAVNLNNLAQLLQAMNRLVEAEPLMRRTVGILLKFTQATGHQHPHLQVMVGNYARLLQALGIPDAEVHERLNELLGEYGMSLG